MTGPVDIHDDRRMVRGGGLAFPGLPIDLRPNRPLSDRPRRKQVVDSHPEILVEVSGAVIPPGEAAGLGMMPAVDIDQPPLAQTKERLTLPRRHVRSPMTEPRIPDILVRWGDVEVTAENERLVRIR